MTSEVDFAKWLAEAPPGARIVYHVGNIARERKAWTDRDGVRHQPIAGLDKLAKAVSKAAESGAIAVAQKRIGPE